VSELLVVDLGTLPYGPALELQRDVARRRISGEIGQDVLLLVEHPPVVTLGRTAKTANLVASPEFLASQGVELFEVERGGDITFHGPGQLVGYPVIDLKRHRRDLHWYLRQVEEALIQAVATFGISAGRVDKYTGVWVNVSETAGRDSEAASAAESTVAGSEFPAPGPQTRSPRKLASIGVHARDWVTWHGFALNVNTDLRYFDLIVPCGISDVIMTSVSRELDAGSIAMQVATDEVTRAFGNVFNLTPQTVPVSGLATTGVVGAEAGAVTPPLP
jgi:lipoyl(octanoyl) transferase